MQQSTSIQLPLAGRKLLYTHLRTIVASGTSLQEGLALLATAPHRGVRQVCAQLRVGADAGEQDIATLLAPSLPPEEAALLGVGEQTGKFVQILDALITRCDQKIEIRNDLLKRAAYPIFVVVMAGVILPIPTMITDGVGAYGAAVLFHLARVALLLGGISGLVRLWMRTRHVALRRMPGGLEMIIVSQPRADFLRVLRAGITAGLPISLTLDAAAQVWLTAENEALTRTALRRIEAGDRLADAVQPLLTRIQTFEVSAAEQSGSLDEALERLVDDADARARTRRRIMAVVTAGVIGLAVLGYVAMKITGSLHKAVMPDSGIIQELQQELDGTGVNVIEFEPPSLNEAIEWSNPQGEAEPAGD